MSAHRLRTRYGELPSEPSFARTRERAGTRRGKGPRPPAAPPRRSAMRIALGGIGFAPEMIARKAIMPHIDSYMERGQHDRVSDIAVTGWPRRHRSVGRTRMSAEIIRFIPRPNRNRDAEDFSTFGSRSAALPDDLTMDHVDTAPCEYVWSDSSKE